MVEVFAALPRKGSQEVAEHSLVIVLRASLRGSHFDKGGRGGGVDFMSFYHLHLTFSVAV